MTLRVRRTDNADGQSTDDGQSNGDSNTEGGGGDALPGVPTLRLDRKGGELLRPHRTAEGFIFAEGFVAKPGILEYKFPDGRIQRELVLPEELGRQDSLKTLGRKPLTLEHPHQDVDPSNVGQLGVGDVGEEIVVTEGGFVKVKLAVRREDAISNIESGTRLELSPGYTVRVDPTPGVHPEFGAYDAVQRDRRYNHVALTIAARGGSDIRLRADAAIQHLPSAEGPMNYEELLKALIDAGVKRADAEKALISLKDGGRQDAKSDQAVIDALLGAIKSAAKDNAALQAKVDIFEKEEKDRKDAKAAGPTPEQVKKDAKELLDKNLSFHTDRARLENLAKMVKLDTSTDELKSADNPTLARAIAKAAKPDLREDASDDWITAYLDIYEENSSSGDRSPFDDIRIDSKGPKKPKADGDDGDRETKSDSDRYLDSLNNEFQARKTGKEISA